jgi:hypothetical protein
VVHVKLVGYIYGNEEGKLRRVNIADIVVIAIWAYYSTDEMASAWAP